jgi:hypothetical protein
MKLDIPFLLSASLLAISHGVRTAFAMPITERSLDLLQSNSLAMRDESGSMLRPRVVTASGKTGSGAPGLGHPDGVPKPLKVGAPSFLSYTFLRAYFCIAETC